MNKTTKFVLGSLLLANLMVSMDTTILNTTGPIVTDEIGGKEHYAWMFAIYTLLSTISIPIFGKLSDRYGRKKIFIISMIVFIVSSFLCGIASNMQELILFRAIKGLSAGGILPVSSTILGDLLPVEKRGKYQGHISLIWGVSAVLGPLVGSFIVEVLDWRWIFFINIPLGILILSFMSLYKEVKEKVISPINWLSAFYFSITTLSLLTITIVWDWSLYLIPVALLAFYLFYRTERNTDNPFLPIGILKNYPLLFFNVNTFLFFFALFGLESFIPLFLQEAQGASVLVSGLALGGISIGWIFSSYPSGKIVLKYGYRTPILIGNSIITLSTIPFFFYKEDTPIILTFLILVVHGFCYGLIQTTASIGSYELSDEKDKGFSSSLQGFARNIGTSFSLGYMGALVTKDPYYILYAAAILSIFALTVSLIFTFIKRSDSF